MLKNELAPQCDVILPDAAGRVVIGPAGNEYVYHLGVSHFGTSADST
jgi:hypothetical protein